MRILAVLSAVSLVAAFTLLATVPPELPLAHALVGLDSHRFLQAQTAIRGQAPWLWAKVLTPVLQRPVWFLPAALGLILGGCAVTLASRPTPRSRRRRS